MYVCTRAHDSNTNFKSAGHIDTLLCGAADTSQHPGLETRTMFGRYGAVLTNYEGVLNLSALYSW
jgi:hypothetical protein